MTLAAAPEHRLARRLAWIGVLVVGIIAYIVVLRALVATENINFFPTLILLGSVTVPLAVLVFAWGTGAGLGSTAGPVLVAVLGGGIIGTVTAGIWEYDTARQLGALPVIGIGLIEEFAKLIVPLALLAVLPSRRQQSGVIIGIAAGMGFATLETMGYGFTALLQARSLAAVDETLLLRALLVPAGHVAWTGVTVAAIWRIPWARHRGRAVVLAVLAFLLAVILHACWDGINSWVVHIVLGVISIALLLIVLHRTHRQAPAGPPQSAVRAG